MTIYVLYSADYELYLGGNYCDETEVLINPTNNLLNLFENLNIPLTLFADVFSIACYKKHSLFNFPDNAENQLKDAIRRGHDVQAHVHPHWNYTRIEGNTYKFDINYFLLGNLADNKEELYSKIRTCLMTSRTYLNNLINQVDKNYHCIAFRAGGYGLQPNSDIVIKALIDSGFIIDTSIVPDSIFKSNANEIDFSIVPKMANYYLEYDLHTPSDNNQGIFEIPIASCTFNIMETSFHQITILLTFFQNKTFHRKLPGSFTKEKGYTILQSENKPRHSKYYNFLKAFNDRFYYLDCSTNVEKMFQCTKKYLNRFDYINKNIFFSVNMHPKEMTKEHCNALENYHNKLKDYYKDNIQAISYQQAAEMVAKKPL